MSEDTTHHNMNEPPLRVPESSCPVEPTIRDYLRPFLTYELEREDNVQAIMPFDTTFETITQNAVKNAIPLNANSVFHTWVISHAKDDGEWFVCFPHGVYSISADYADKYAQVILVRIARDELLRMLNRLKNNN